MTKKVLCITYYYPPIQTSGTLRSLEFSKLIPEHGWVPDVLTVSESKDPWTSKLAKIPSNISIHRSTELPFRKLLDLIDYPLSKIIKLLGGKGQLNYAYEYFGVPDEFVGWCPVFRAAKLGKSADAIYVSCSPFSAGLVAILAGKLSGRPVVIDFRDCWSNWVGKRSNYKLKLSKLFERFYIGHCAAFIANTRSSGEYYKTLFPEFQEKIHVIPNGFDKITTPESYTPSPFKIMHIGTFYGERKPDLLLQALSELNLPDLEFVQVGGKVDCTEKIRNKVKIVEHEAMDHDSALELMKSASLLYLKQAWSEPGRPNLAVAQKTYEYLATGLPILAECSEGDNLEVVKNFCNNPYLVSSDDLGAMKDCIGKAYEQRDSTKPLLKAEAIESYHRPSLAAKLASILDDVTK